MAGGITTRGGSVIEGYDASSVDLLAPSGARLRIPIASAPPDVVEALGMARAGAPSAPRPFGIDLDMGGPTRAMPAATSAAAPAAAAQEPAADPANVELDPMAAAQARLQALRSAPQVQAVGGGTRTVTQRQGFDPAAVESASDKQTDVMLAREDQALAGEEAAEAESAGKREIAAVGESMAADLERVKREGEADARTERTRMEAETGKLQALQKAAATEIDPKRFWNSKSTGEKVMAAFAVGLGAFGQALAGGENPALRMIEKAISDDLAAQEANQANRRASVSQQSEMMGRVSQMYADADSRRRAFTLAAREHAAAMSDAIGAKTADKTIRAQAQAFSAQIREKNALDEQAFLLKTAGQVSTTTTPTGGGLALSPQAREAEQLSRGIYGAYDEKALVLGAEKYGLPPSAAVGGETDARDINKRIAAADELVGTIDRLRALSTQKLSPEASAASRALKAQAAVQLKELKDMGALDKGAIEITDQMLGKDPTAWWRPGGNAELTQTRAAIVRGVGSQLQNRTKPVDPALVPLALRVRRRAPSGGAGAPPASKPLVEP